MCVFFVLFFYIYAIYHFFTVFFSEVLSFQATSVILLNLSTSKRQMQAQISGNSISCFAVLLKGKMTLVTVQRVVWKVSFHFKTSFSLHASTRACKNQHPKPSATFVFTARFSAIQRVYLHRDSFFVIRRITLTLPPLGILETCTKSNGHGLSKKRYHKCPDSAANCLFYVL